MKRFISLVLVTLLALGCTVAFADADYSSMTDEELNVLLEAIQAELASRAPAEAETGDAETGDTETSEADVPEGALVFGENVVLIDQDDVKVYLTGNTDSIGNIIELEAIVENNSDKDVSVDVDSASVNGWEIYVGGISDTSAGKKQKADIDVLATDADVTSIEQIDELYIEFYLYDSNEYNRISDNIPVTIVFPD